MVSDDFFAPHLAYFQHNCDDFCREACINIDGKPDVEEKDGDGGQTNLNKTVQVILDNTD